MASVKSMMNCIGISTNTSVSVLSDLFGFSQGRVPPDPCGATGQVSMLNHIRSLKGKHFHLNIIRVGGDMFFSDDFIKIDSAILNARRVYRTVDLGIGRIQHFDVTWGDANGKHDIGSKAEARDLTHDWTVLNNGIDTFMVVNISDSSFVGFAPVNGPCDKSDMRMNGVLAGEIGRTPDEVARTFSHEIGHYLGLFHNHMGNCPNTKDECNNLMAQTRCAVSCGDGVCEAMVLTTDQGHNVRNHCFVQDGC